jgi:catechol 2,3-dioxygenase-like lactoylglutathione lyase family enzyme
MSQPERIRFLSAVLLTSRQAERLSRFYAEVLGLPLAEERHGNTPLHWGCELGDVHFAIHPRGDAPAPGPIRLAFWVFDLEAFAKGLLERGVALRYPVRPLGPNSLITAILDPDGNEIELTQMGDDWVGHLAEHRRRGGDLLSFAARKPALD